ncbi:MAG: GGDEF domain-containing protein [Devosia sp.]|uniref:GGDEF domain-containing protein n=1 Tax=Devosia sp. TaxID=1871048 RepID=UPI003391A7ED
MAQVDVFSLAAAVTALLLAVALLVAYAINRRLRAFVWWAGSFVLLSLWLATATLRLGAPVAWVLWISWGSLFAAACLVAYGLHRAGATRVSPFGRILACGALFVVIASTLTLLHARPHYWFLIGPIPTLIFMAWSAVLVYRAGAWGYGLTLVAGIATITMLSLIHPGGLARALAPDRPFSALRGGFDGASDPGHAIALNRPPPPMRGVLDFAPPPGPHPPVEQPLTVTLITVVALLALAIALVLRDMLTELDRMRERSTTDAMTGLLNRVTFEETAAALLREPSASPACMILFDIDHFKRINDTAGHAAGDRVIARLGLLLREMTLVHHPAGRVGGEEFAVILGNSDLAAARLFADTIRAGLSASDFGEEIGWGVTVSAGIALRRPGENLHALMARADAALYAAKNSGRDQVVTQDIVDLHPRHSAPANLAASIDLGRSAAV